MSGLSFSGLAVCSLEGQGHNSNDDDDVRDLVFYIVIMIMIIVLMLMFIVYDDYGTWMGASVGRTILFWIKAIVTYDKHLDNMMMMAMMMMYDDGQGN